MKRQPSKIIIWHLLLFQAFLGCKASKPSIEVREAATPSDLPLEVLYSGCKEVIAGPICLMPKDKGWFDLWVRSDAQAKINIIAETTKRRGPVTIQGGLRYELKLAPSAKDIRVKTIHGNYSTEWILPLGVYTPVLKEESGLVKKGRLSQARQRIEASLDSLKKEQLGYAKFLLGKAAMAEEKHQMAIELLEEATRLLRKEGFLYTACFASNVLAFVLAESVQNYQYARAALSVAPVEKSHMDSAFLIAHEQGNLALRLGDYRNAFKYFKFADNLARRVNAIGKVQLSSEMLAVVLQYMGRSEEAEELFDSLLSSLASALGNPVCHIADLLLKKGWIRVSSTQPASSQLEDATALSKQALQLLEKKSCSRKRYRINYLHMCLATAYLRLEQLEDASKHIQSFLPNPKTERDMYLMKQDLLARLALAKGQPTQALQIFTDLQNQAKLEANLEHQFRADFGRAQALWRLGMLSKALVSFEHATKMALRISEHIALGQGKSTFLSQRERAIQMHLRFLIETKQPKKAFNLIRQYRSWMLGALDRSVRISGLKGDARASWEKLIGEYVEARKKIDGRTKQLWGLADGQKTLEQTQIAHEVSSIQNLLDRAYKIVSDNQPVQLDSLSLPPKGTLMLSFFPLDDQWIGFAANQNNITIRELGPIDTKMPKENLSKKLLQPFRKQIEENDTIAVLPSGQIDEIDLHDLPWLDGILLESKRIVYSLDLPPQPSKPKQAGEKLALVVADPESNLPNARKEVPRVFQSLESKNWKVAKLVGGEATLQRVRTSLEQSNWFHFSGHGRYSGIDGWESGLRLAEDTNLTIGDILVLDKVPETVILLGCETGRSSPNQVASVSLAYAFLVAGSQFVVASKRPVSDKLANRLASFIYAENHVVGATRRFQINMARSDEKIDWSAFRIYVRHIK